MDSQPQNLDVIGITPLNSSFCFGDTLRLDLAFDNGDRKRGHGHENKIQ
jgi:hypothetical protein